MAVEKVERAAERYTEVDGKRIHAVKSRRVGDDLKGIPDGWPEGIDGEEVVAEWIFNRTEKLRGEAV